MFIRMQVCPVQKQNLLFHLASLALVHVCSPTLRQKQIHLEKKKELVKTTSFQSNLEDIKQDQGSQELPYHGNYHFVELGLFLDFYILFFLCLYPVRLPAKILKKKKKETRSDKMLYHYYIMLASHSTIQRAQFFSLHM